MIGYNKFADITFSNTYMYTICMLFSLYYAPFMKVAEKPAF